MTDRFGSLGSHHEVALKEVFAAEPMTEADLGLDNPTLEDWTKLQHVFGGQIEGFEPRNGGLREISPKTTPHRQTDIRLGKS